MAKGGKGKKPGAATAEKKVGGAKGRKDQGDADDGGTPRTGDELGDNLLGLGSVTSEAAEHAQATVTEGWGWANPGAANRKSQASANDAASKHSRTAAYATQNAPGGNDDQWYSPPELRSPGPATARGGGGGGWDMASSIGTSPSVAGPQKRNNSVTFNPEPTFVLESRQRMNNKLSTVHEASVAMSERSSMASATAEAGMKALLAAGSMSPDQRVSRTSTELRQSRTSFNAPSINPTLVLSTLNPGSPAPRLPSGISQNRGSNSMQRAGETASFPPTTPARVTSPGARSVSLNSMPSPSAKPHDATQVYYSGGGTSPSVVRLTNDPSNGKMQVFVPPNSQAQLQVHMAMPSPRISRTSSAPTVKSNGPGSPLPGAWPGGFPDPGPSSMPEPHRASSSNGHQSIAVSPNGKGKEVDWSGLTDNAHMSMSGGGNGILSGNGGVWDWPPAQNHERESQAPPPPPPPPEPTPKPRRSVAPPLPKSQALQRASSPTTYPPRPEPTHDARIQETGGLALKPAERAMFGRHRHAMERFYWTLPPAHDERVESLLEWVETMGWSLAALGLSKFLAWKQRGALFANADFRPWKSPDEPAFDWMTFEQVQNTLDKTVQESIATYDPATTALVFVFLVSKSGSSLGIWRRRVPLPPSLQLKHAIEIDRVKKDLAKQQNLVVKVERPMSARTPIPISPPPPPQPRQNKKRKWWQFWKSNKPDPPAIPEGKENRAPNRGKLAKRR